MNRLFISYRREDSAHITGRIYDRLLDHFGKDNVFKDVDNIPVGGDFREALRGFIDECDAVLVVIGPGWLGAPGGEVGRRRIDDDEDFVRFEVEAALGVGLLLIPVLVDQTPMPRPEQLPPSIRRLSYCNAAQVRGDPDFHRDVNRLVRQLKGLSTAGTDGPRRTRSRPGPGGKADAGRSAEGGDDGPQPSRGPRTGKRAGASGAAPGSGSGSGSKFERLWRELGPDRAMEHLEDLLRDEDEPRLRAALRFLRGHRDAAAIPMLFHLLAHRSEPIRRRAKTIVQGFGWPEVADAGIALARRAAEERGPRRVGFLLEGLAAIEANPDVVGLLERLVVELQGGLRTRAILLLERKRLGLQLERIAALFRDKNSPYRIEKVLGQGLVTAAYLARHELTDRPLVVRVLRPEFVGQPKILALFLDVSKRSFGYVHQGLVQLRDVQAITDHGIYYTVRDYVEGVTLQAVLAEGKRFEPPQALEILRQALEALSPVHRDGAAHGGIKPSNLFLCDGERVRVILGDPSPPTMGLVDLERLSYDYRYAPPEHFRSGPATGPRSDFYAIGCLAYELLCGAPPFVADNPFELIARHGRESIPPPSLRGCPLGRPGDGWVQRLLARSPDDRYADLDEALGALRALVEALDPRPGSPPYPVSILGRDSLARYDAPESVLRLTGPPGTDWRSLADVSPRPDPEATIPPEPATLGGTGAETPASAVTPAPRTNPPAPDTQGSTGIDSGGDPGRHGDLRPGMDFGRYRIERKLGEGGMGAVYLAKDTLLDRRVALKIPRFFGGAPEIPRRFMREARSAASLNHPNICPIYDVGVLDGVYYLTMAHIEGEPLSSLVSREGPMPQERAAEIVGTVARALATAHDRGIIHRDLKPSNILIDPERGPIVLDFGIARRENDGDGADTREGALIGTPAYMSPEQIEGRQGAIGPATDIYSLGVVLFELLTGRRPFLGSVASVLSAIMTLEPPPPSSLRPDLDPILETICRRAMARRVEGRYASMLDLAADLDAYLFGASAPPAGAGRSPGARPDRADASPIGGGPPRPGAGWWGRLRSLLGGRRSRPR